MIKLIIIISILTINQVRITVTADETTTIESIKNTEAQEYPTTSQDIHYDSTSPNDDPPEETTDAPIEFDFAENEEFNTIIQKLAATARVASALSLRYGIYEESIPVDDVIAELLNIPTNVLKGLKTFDKQKVDAFVDQIDGVSLKTDTEELEKGLADAFMIRKLWTEMGGATALSGLPDDATYKQLKEVRNLDITTLTSLSLESPIDQLSKFSTLSNDEIDTLKSELSEITKEFTKWASFDFSKYINILNSLKPLDSLSQIVSIYNREHEFQADVLGAQVVSGVVSNFRQFSPLFSSSSESDSVVDSMNSIISSRLFDNPMMRPHTAGFVNGYKDLEKLNGDVTDQWLLAQINSSIDVKGVEVLIQLVTLMETLDNEWIKASTENVYYSMKQLAHVRRILSTSFDTNITEDELKSVLKSIVDSNKGKRELALYDKLKQISKNAEALHKKLSILNSILPNMKNNQIEEKIQDLSNETSVDHVQKIEEFLRRLRTQSHVVTSGIAIKNTRMDTSDTEFITDFKSNSVTKPLFDVFNIFEKFGEDFEKVGRSAMTLVEIRKLKSGTGWLDNVKSVASTLSESSGSLETIRSSMNSLKEEFKKITVSEEFQKPRNLRQLSKSFGGAVNFLVMAKKAIEKASDFKKFIENGRSIREGVAESKNEDTRLEFMEKWGDFGSTTSQIISILTSIDGWSSGMKVTENTTLSNYAPLFSHVPNLDYVDLETDDRMKAVDQLGNDDVDSDAKTQFTTSLTTLSKLDLKFSRFQSSINMVSDTLKDLSSSLKDLEPIDRHQMMTTPKEENRNREANAAEAERQRLENFLKEDKIINDTGYGSSRFGFETLAISFVVIQLLQLVNHHLAV